MLPSKLRLISTFKQKIINCTLYMFKMWTMMEDPQCYYLVNWRNDKHVRVWKGCRISQKAINKNAIHLESLLELLESDNECLILANQILGETTYFYTTWNIVKRLI